jgi:type IV fimbrial biogenesis protein FimT
MEAMIRKTLNAGRIGHSPLTAGSRGFSLIEVMMSLVLLGIGMALALPSYRDMVEKRQVTNGAEQVASFINVAQGVAMKTNQVVTVSYARTDDDDWCIGAVSGETACDCAETEPTELDYCQIASQPFVLNNTHASDRELVHSVTGDGAYAFDPIRGLFVDLDDSLQMELRSPSDQFRLNVMVNNTGRVILCSNSSDHAIPGYQVCPAQPVEVEVAES